MESADKAQFLAAFAPVFAVVGLAGMVAWIVTTWIRVKNGYPLQGSWGQAMYPRKNDELIERVKLISQENAQLRAELGSIKDRLAVMERIVTDGNHSLEREIEGLRARAN